MQTKGVDVEHRKNLKYQLIGRFRQIINGWIYIKRNEMRFILRALFWGLSGLAIGYYIGNLRLAFILVAVSLVIDSVVHLLCRKTAAEWEKAVLQAEKEELERKNKKAAR